MTKEFENFKNILGQKQNELETQTRITQKAKDDETTRKQAENRQRQIESEQKAVENKRILENTGVIKLFEEIRDSGIAKWSDKPFYEEKTQEVPIYKDGFFSRKLIKTNNVTRRVLLSNFQPAKIIFGKENKYIELRFKLKDDESSFNDFLRIYPLSNGKIGTLDFDIPEGKTIFYKDENGEKINVSKMENNSLKFYRGHDSNWGNYNVLFTQPKEVEIKDLSNYVASKLIHPDKFDFYQGSYAEP